MSNNQTAKRHFEVMYRHTVRNPNGYSISCGDKGTIEHDTQMCVHCGQHWDVKPGSGNIRGFCRKCNGMVCGSHACMECFPLEKRFEFLESGKIPYLMAPLDLANKKRFFTG